MCPIYEFVCSSCGKSEDKLLKVSEIDNEQTCQCGNKQTLNIGTPGFTFAGYHNFSAPRNGQHSNGWKYNLSNDLIKKNK